KVFTAAEKSCPTHTVAHARQGHVASYLALHIAGRDDDEIIAAFVNAFVKPCILASLSVEDFSSGAADNTVPALAVTSQMILEDNQSLLQVNNPASHAPW
ncbi:hypothetical protein GOP47_0020340, partial [Adiantum capillus-veneris]